MTPSTSTTGARHESPKLATFAMNLPSNNMLLALISQWNIGGSASVCRYRMPLANPRAILNLIAKLGGSLELTIVKHNIQTQVRQPKGDPLVCYLA